MNNSLTDEVDAVSCWFAWMISLNFCSRESSESVVMYARSAHTIMMMTMIIRKFITHT